MYHKAYKKDIDVNVSFEKTLMLLSLYVSCWLPEEILMVPLCLNKQILCNHLSA